MEVERERYAVTGSKVVGKTIIPGTEHKIGPTEKFEFGVPGDAMSFVVKGGYVSNWNADFLQRELGRDGTCARYYFDSRVAVDIGDPEDSVSKIKRKLLFKHGFGYFCIPARFENDEKKLQALYDTALAEYFEYEKKHPRPKVFQETITTDEKGVPRRVMMSAIDIRVGGGLIGSVVQQKAEMREASKLTKSELREIKIRSKLRRKLRISIESGVPFRNPFVAKDRRLYPVQYNNAA